MPYLKVQTNLPVEESARKAFLATASRTVAEALGKPEQYVVVLLQPDLAMLFAGTDAPLAFVELKSIGLMRDQTAELSRTLCDLISGAFGIPADRVYIEFAEAQPDMWGWNAVTF